MRPSLLPGLVAAAQANANRGYADVALFEVGQIFKGDRPENQFVAASGVRHGFASSKGMGRHWSGSAMTDALDAKADAFAVLAAAGAPMQALQIVPGGASWLHPGRSGTIQIGPQNVLGYFRRAASAHAGSARRRRPAGRVRGHPRPHSRRQEEADPRQAAARPLRVPAGVARLRLHRRSRREGRRHRAIGAGVDKKLITDVTVFDVYEGKGIDPDKKSVAIAVTIQPREKTLTGPGDRRGGGKDRGRGDEEDRRRPAGMSLLGLIPSEVSLNAAIAICAVAFVSGRRGDFPASARR
jgi:phenylalanyl-tRNA synthetase beta chain